MGIGNRLRSPARRVGYYSAAIAREIMPHRFWTMRKERWFAELAQVSVDDELRDRVRGLLRVARLHTLPSRGLRRRLRSRPCRCSARPRTSAAGCWARGSAQPVRCRKGSEGRAGS